MTFTNTEIAEVYAQEQTLEDKKGRPVFAHVEPSFWELLYIGGSEEDFAHTRQEYIPKGYQVKKVGQPKKKIPAWALDNRFYLYVFGEEALRRARVAYLHWRVGMTPTQIAAETHWSEKTIRNIITKLQAKTAKYSQRAGTVQVSIGGANLAEAEQAPLDTSNARPN